MESDPTTDLPTEYCGVVCDDHRLVEVDLGRIAVKIRRADIQQITLGHGLQAPHPVLQIAVGAALALLAYFPLVHVFWWLKHGGTLFSQELWLIAFSSIGVWMILAALRRGHFLELETLEGRKRLAFQKQAEPPKIDEFVKRIEARYRLRVVKR